MVILEVVVHVCSRFIADYYLILHSYLYKDTHFNCEDQSDPGYFACYTFLFIHRYTLDNPKH